jgi:hypothetical protein
MIPRKIQFNSKFHPYLLFKYKNILVKIPNNLIKTGTSRTQHFSPKEARNFYSATLRYFHPLPAARCGNQFCRATLSHSALNIFFT